MKIYSKIVFVLLLLIYILQGCKQLKNGIEEKILKNQIDFNYYKIIELTNLSEGNFVKPKFTIADKCIAFLSEDFSSLWTKDIETKKLNRIYYSKNKITDFIFTGKFDSVFIVEKDYEPNAQIKSRLLFAANGIIKQIYSSKKSLSSLSLSNKNNLIFFDGNEIKFFNTEKFLPADKLNDFYSSVFIDTSNVLIYMNGKTHKINLTNKQNVVWVSPIAEDSLLIYSPEDKLILLSLSQTDILKIGDLTTPVYNKIYKKVAVLKQTDNGMKEIFSDIYLLNLRNLKERNLTETPNQIESNICWSHDGSRLAFDVSGRIKFILFGQNKPITK